MRVNGVSAMPLRYDVSRVQMGFHDRFCAGFRTPG
jgi:hypothetical protein